MKNVPDNYKLKKNYILDAISDATAIVHATMIKATLTLPLLKCALLSTFLCFYIHLIINYIDTYFIDIIKFLCMH